MDPNTPQQPYQQYPPNPNNYNTLSIIGLVLAVVFAPVGLVLCILALKEIKKTHQEGRMLAIIGVIISGLQIALVVIGFALLALLVTLGSGATQSNARDTERKNDINILQSKLQEYYSEKGYYPTARQFAGRDWMITAPDPEAFNGPAGEQYSYDVSDAECTEQGCDSYSLSAVLEKAPEGSTSKIYKLTDKD